MTDNELIAEFMGFEVTGTMPVSGQRIYSLPYVDTSLANHYFGPHRSEQMRFDTSWDWLMPVVDKIDKMTLIDETYFRTNINGSRNRTHCYIYKYHPGASVGTAVSEGHEDKKIESVYRAVVEFIKWYNSTKETTPQPPQTEQHAHPTAPTDLLD